MDDTCAVERCPDGASRKGWCNSHYRRWKRHGDPLGGRRRVPRAKGTPAQRFWPKVDQDGPVPAHRPDLGPCWVWRTTAATDNGYPQFRVGERMVLAYRFAYELLVGPIPDDRPQLDHLCRNRKCVRPSHLEPVTNAENSRRIRGLHYAPRCRKDLHNMTDDNVRVTSTGIRVCRTCSPGRRPDFDTHCAHGHPWSEYAFTTSIGRRACRACQAGHSARSYARQKA